MSGATKRAKRADSREQGAPHPMPANRLEWQYMTGDEIDALDREKTVVVVTNSPLEVHGPHLPVVTDNLEAEGLLLRMMERMAVAKPEYRFLHLPPMYIAADVLPHVGSVKFRSSTIRRVTEDLGRTLAKQGFRHIWVSSFHGGPRHFVPIEVGAHNTNRRYGTRMVSLFSMLIQVLSGGRTDLPTLFGRLPGLTPQDLEGDAHGGAVETSMMLHLLGEHVKEYRNLEHRTVDLERARNGLPPYPMDEKPSVRQLVTQMIGKLKYYEQVTYSGQPALATAELGEQMLDILADAAVEPLVELLEYRRDLSATHSPVWPIRWIFASDLPSWVVETAVGYRSKVW